MIRQLVHFFHNSIRFLHLNLIQRTFLTSCYRNSLFRIEFQTFFEVFSKNFLWFILYFKHFDLKYFSYRIVHRMEDFKRMCRMHIWNVSAIQNHLNLILSPLKINSKKDTRQFLVHCQNKIIKWIVAKIINWKLTL